MTMCNPVQVPEDPAEVRAEEALRRVRELDVKVDERLKPIELDAKAGRAAAETAMGLIQAHVNGAPDRARDYEATLRRWLGVAGVVAVVVATVVPQCSSAVPALQTLLELVEETNAR